MTRSSKQVRDVVPGGDDQWVPVSGSGQTKALCCSIGTLQQPVMVGLAMP